MIRSATGFMLSGTGQKQIFGDDGLLPLKAFHAVLIPVLTQAVCGAKLTLNLHIISGSTDHTPRRMAATRDIARRPLGIRDSGVANQFYELLRFNWFASKVQERPLIA